MAGAGLDIDHVDPLTGVRSVSPVPLPAIGPDGSVVFAPDWAALESILAVLLAEANLPSPGALQSDIEARWAEIVVGVPLEGGEGSCEIVLHDAHAYAAFRERSVVRAGADGVDATGVLPEVRIILSEIVGRLRVASPPLASLLGTLGIIRSDGLDPSAIDRLVHDPATTLLPVIRAGAAELATDLRGLLGTPTTGLAATAVRIGNPMAYVEVGIWPRAASKPPRPSPSPMSRPSASRSPLERAPPGSR